MAAILQLRRGTTASKPTLSAGEMYVNTTSQSLQVGIDGSNEITLAKLNSVNSGSFNVSGDITLGGTITIGDATSDNIVINADLSSSLIPNNDNSFDLGSTSFRYRNVNATSISGAIASTNGVVSGSSQVIGILSSLNSFSASNGNTSLNSYTSSQDTKNTTLATYTGSIDTKFTTLQTLTASNSSSIGQINSVTASLNLFTASNINTSLNLYTSSANVWSGSIDTKNTSLATITGSLISTASLLEAKNLSLATTTGSLISSSSIDASKFTTLATYTSSLETKNASLATITGSLIISSSIDTNKFATLATYTSSLNVWTSSVATTGSNTFTNNQIITGSLTITGSAKGNVVPITIASSTASLDMNAGSYFTLTLANTTTTHIRATNITPGTTATLLITTGTNSSASLAPTLLQPSGSFYTASFSSGKKDVLSLVSFDTTNMYVVSTKTMQ